MDSGPLPLPTGLPRRSLAWVLAVSLTLAAAAGWRYGPEWVREREHERLVATITAGDTSSAPVRLRRIQAETDPATARAVLHDPRTVTVMARYVTDPTGPALERRLAALETFDPEWRRKVRERPSVETTIFEHYGARIREAFDPAAGRYDYRAAQQNRHRLARLYPDSPTLATLSGLLEQRKAEAIESLARGYEAVMAAPRIEPHRFARDVTSARARLRQLDSRHPLLTDPRARLRLLDAVRQSMAEEDHRRTAALLDAAGDAFQDPEITRLRADLERETARREDERRAHEAASRLASSRERMQTLDDMLAARRDLALLAELRPRDPLVRDLRWQLEQQLATELARHVEQRRWLEAETLLLNVAGLLGLDFLSAQRAALSEAEAKAGVSRPTTSAHRARRREQVLVVNTLLREPVLDTDWETRFGQAFKEFVALSDVDDPGVATVRRTLSLLYRDRARQTLAAGRAGEALALVEKGRAFEPESRELEAVAREIAASRSAASPRERK